MITQGVRRDEVKLHNLQPGEYGLEDDGAVRFCLPNGLCGRTRLGVWTHELHEDGTITIAPSIKVDAGRAGTWHGYLERGVWREMYP